MTFYTSQRERTRRKESSKVEVEWKKDLNKIFILLLSENIVAVLVFCWSFDRYFLGGCKKVVLRWR